MNARRLGRIEYTAFCPERQATDTRIDVPLVDDDFTRVVPKAAVGTVPFRRVSPGDLLASATTVAMPGVPRAGVPTEALVAHRPRTKAPARGQRKARWVLAACAALLLLGVTAAFGMRAVNERDARQRTREAVAQALWQGNAQGLLMAGDRLREAILAHPEETSLRARRARVLGALLVECGGIGDAQKQQALVSEAEAAVRPLTGTTMTDGLLSQAYLALWRGDGAAVMGLSAALRKEAREPALADYFVGLAALWRGDARTAVTALERSVQSPAPRETGAGPSSGPPPMRQVFRARALRMLGNDAAARKALEAALHQQPDQPAALVEVAGLDILAAPGDAARDRALSRLRGLLASPSFQGRGPRAAAYMVLAEAALSPPASYREARLFLEQAEAVRPLGDPLLLSRLASVSLRAQDPGAAAAAARAALRLSPAQTDLQVLLSRALLQEGRVAEAQGVLGEVLSSLPPGREAIGARLLLLRSRLQQGDLLTAQREVEQLLLEHPEGEQRVQARLLLARLGLMQKPPLRSEALGLLQSVVSEAPGLVEGRQLLGQLLGQLGRPAEAMVQLREALRLSQADPSTAGQG